jgi:hypothetical protein
VEVYTAEEVLAALIAGALAGVLFVIFGGHRARWVALFYGFMVMFGVLAKGHRLLRSRDAIRCERCPLFVPRPAGSISNRRHPVWSLSRDRSRQNMVTGQ